jgi:hypothetical protein
MKRRSAQATEDAAGSASKRPAQEGKRLAGTRRQQPQKEADGVGAFHACGSGRSAGGPSGGVAAEEAEACAGASSPRYSHGASSPRYSFAPGPEAHAAASVSALAAAAASVLAPVSPAHRGPDGAPSAAESSSADAIASSKPTPVKAKHAAAQLVVGADGAAPRNPRFAALWREGRFCDVTIRVGAALFPAHRLVLAAESEYLNVLFCGSFKDSNAPTVEIHDVSPETFGKVMEFMYDGKCELKTLESLEPLLAAASILQVQSLVSTAAHEMEKFVGQENCIAMLVYADRHHLPRLTAKAEAAVKHNFLQLASNPAIPKRSWMALLQSDHLNVTTELEVYQALSAWLKGQTKKVSEQEQLAMLELVRFALLPQAFVDNTVMQSPELSNMRGREILISQFKEAYFGNKPSQRQVTAEFAREQGLPCSRVAEYLSQEGQRLFQLCQVSFKKNRKKRSLRSLF